MAVPRSLRPKLAVAIALIFLSAVCLLYSPLVRTGLTGQRHANLTEKDDIGLIFPYDPVPRRDFASLSKYPAHNINNPSRFAFATFYCTRQPDTRDPYFETTQSIIWRLLWSDYRSKYPIIVFVCPFIPEEHRRVFKGQGAIIQEIELLDDIVPDSEISTKRWIDVLSKLNLWKEVEWKRLVFLDLDAFPIRNIDDIFELVQEQQCKKEALSAVDKAVVDSGIGEDMCNYIYAGVPQFTAENINAGMMVLKPNLNMHAKLLRAAQSTDDYEARDMEQGILKSKNAFVSTGPFPVNRLPTIWNADPIYISKHIDNGLETPDGPIRIIHVKMWNRAWGQWVNLTQLNDMWDLDWMKMCRFFEEDGFEEARKTGLYKTPLEKYLEGQKSE